MGACDDSSTHRALEQVFHHRIRIRSVDGMVICMPGEVQ
jgi:hypothetical protein